jgi:cytochrome c551/c552
MFVHMKSKMNNSLSKYCDVIFLFAVLIIVNSQSVFSQAESPKEADYFTIMKMPSPEGLRLEVGGLCTLPNGDIGVATRRGDVFIIENPTSQHPYYRKFATGMHEVLGLAYKDGALYCAQRGELTKLEDTNMDGKADVYETIYAWPLTGNYHEYSYGPKIASDGSFYVTLNCTCPSNWWHMQSKALWRGWALHILPDGEMEPWATGMRSPCGISMIDDSLFYTDNQGDWVGSGSIMPIRKGAFLGHPAGLVWSGMPNSPLKLTREQVYAVVQPPPAEYNSYGEEVQPSDKTEKHFITEFEAKKKIPELELPAVWLPHGILGVSNAEIVKIPDGIFGPFSGQLLISDQGQSMIDRVFMEKVNGEYQGAAWAFRSGFQSGIVRLTWAQDGSLIEGETNRGWGSAGDASEGLQRLVWNKNLPFEMRAIRAMPDGFEIEFTKPVNKKSAEDIASYSVESFIYKYHGIYGSPPINTEKCAVKGIKLSADGLKARIVVDNLRKYYIHTITLNGIRDEENSYTLIHPVAYYTLNNIPGGLRLNLSELSTKNSAANNKPPAKKSGGKRATGAAKSNSAVLSYAEIKPILQANTCLSCHNPDKKQVGPAYVDVAKRNYTIDQIIELIHHPKPRHWPEYSTPMPAMPQVSDANARKIAIWINSLRKTN